MQHNSCVMHTYSNTLKIHATIQPTYAKQHSNAIAITKLKRNMCRIHPACQRKKYLHHICKIRAEDMQIPECELALVAQKGLGKGKGVGNTLQISIRTRVRIGSRGTKGTWQRQRGRKYMADFNSHLGAN